MKKTVRFFIVFLLGNIIFTSCVMYHPQSVDVPLINHKEDLRVDAAFSLTALGLQPALNATASYGFTDWNAAQFHVNWNGGESFYVQPAVGAYKPFGGHFVLEGYAGYGFGYSCYTNKSHDADSSGSAISYTRKYAGTYQLPFVQLNAGWVDLLNGWVDLGAGLKSGAFFPNFRQERTEGSPEYFKTPCPLFEPQLFLRVGGNHFKITLRASICTFFEQADFGYDPTNVSVGFNLRF